MDKDRNWVMPTSHDWDEGTPLNLKEARRMTTGIHVGWAEHKYGYSALQRAAVERKAWPYPWLHHDECPPVAARSGLSGTIHIHEVPTVPISDGSLWVGLSAPEYPSGDRRSRDPIGWQRDGKHYQYWVGAGGWLVHPNRSASRDLCVACVCGWCCRGIRAPGRDAASG